jgi:tetratricopeptide (TPR) repeat protein
MDIDPTNPVVALCAAGIAIEGDADAARRLFEQAWDARQDDYDASIAAHFLARHQPTPSERVRWNALAAQHAELVTDGRTREFKASLYLNLGDALLAAGELESAGSALATAIAHLRDLPDDGYRTFVERGIAGLQEQLTDSRHPRV